MPATVHRLGVPRALPGNRTTAAIDPAGCTVRELIATLASLYGDSVLEELLEGEHLRPEVRVLLNGRNIGSLEGLETRVADGDELLFTLLFVGG